MTELSDDDTNLFFDKKALAVDLLNGALRLLGEKEMDWERTETLGYNHVVDDVELEIADPRYGKVTEFKFSTIVVKDDYAIIMYFQPGSGTYGYGVLSSDGDVCLETTTHDLVEWILPIPSGEWLQERLAFLDILVHHADRLTA